MADVYGIVIRPSKRPPMKSKRFSGAVGVEWGVCSNAVRRSQPSSFWGSG